MDRSYRILFWIAPSCILPIGIGSFWSYFRTGNNIELVPIALTFVAFLPGIFWNTISATLDQHYDDPYSLKFLRSTRYFCRGKVRADIEESLRDCRRDIRQMKKENRSRAFISTATTWQVVMTIVGALIGAMRRLIQFWIGPPRTK